MAFAVEERTSEWIASAPLRVDHAFDVHAPPHAVFSVLSDHVSWPVWYSGIHRVRVLEGDGGERTLRTVWYRGARVNERVLLYEEPSRIVFAVISSNVPGLKSMVTDWCVAPLGAGRSRLMLSVGIECSGALRFVPWLLRPVLSYASNGARGIARIVG
ncbi:MAG: SRPBCC family protein [Acidimicrobiales bacterium]